MTKLSPTRWLFKYIVTLPVASLGSVTVKLTFPSSVVLPMIWPVALKSLISQVKFNNGSCFNMLNLPCLVALW